LLTPFLLLTDKLVKVQKSAFFDPNEAAFQMDYRQKTPFK